MTGQMVTQNELTQKAFFPDKTLPWLVQAAPGSRFDTYRGEIEEIVAQQLSQSGAILFRGFNVEGMDDFQSFAQWFSEGFLDYDYGSTPRSRVHGSVYSSTEYPADRTISLHNEMAYARSWPMKLWFFSVEVAAIGGETPIADSREIYRMIPQKISDKFVEKRLRYIRNYRPGLDLSWQQAFNTQDPAEMMRFCEANKIEATWFGKELRTVQECQAVISHPLTKEKAWFNQAHLFHASALELRLRQALSTIYKPEQLPRNVFFGDGSPIPDADLEEVRRVLDQATIVFPWQQGDILMLDNMLTAHGRKPYQGSRKTVVIMA